MKKMNLKNKVTLLNSLSTLLLQFVTIISGFIVPKIVLSYFGSEVNGLVSSLNQFLNYIALLEGGVTGVITANLFKPLVNKDYQKISSVINTTRKFYKQIGMIFVFYSIVLSFTYPLIFKTNFSYLFVVSLGLILSTNLFIQYMFSLTYRTLLNADKKNYIVSISHTIIIILNIILVYLSVKIYPSIHVLKAISGSLFIIQPIIYSRYVKRHYYLDKNELHDNALLKSRWNGLAVNIAAFIHVNTDITILTLFTNFATVSVYSVYYMITSSIRQLVTSISSGISPTIGHAYAKGNEEELNKKMDIYEFIMFFSTFLLFTISALLITPFVMIYTHNITDANYYQPLFGVLIILSEGLYIIKNPHVNLAYNANKFKEITIPCYIEAIINIIISTLLVSKYGLIGVAIGTICAMIYRMIFHVWFTDKKLFRRPQIKFYGKILTFTFTTIIGVLICYFIIPKVEFNIFNWLLHGIIYSIILFVLYLINSMIFYKKELNELKKYFKR